MNGYSGAIRPTVTQLPDGRWHAMYQFLDIEAVAETEQGARSAISAIFDERDRNDPEFRALLIGFLTSDNPPDHPDFKVMRMPGDEALALEAELARQAAEERRAIEETAVFEE